MPMKTGKNQTETMSEKKKAKSSRTFVHDCVISLAGKDAQDDAPISSIDGLSADDLGGCLNDSIPLKGKQAFKRGSIKESDTLQDVINATDVRRQRQP